MRRGAIPEWITEIKFDLIIFHTVFISQRWLGRDEFTRTVYPLIEPLRNSRAKKIVLPQDEWIHTDALVSFINDFNINIVFSVAPESEYKIIYDGVDFEKVKFYKVLTGYVDDKVLNKIKHLKSLNISRTTDIGYRAFKSPEWLGSHGYLKTKIAEVFLKNGRQFKLDISTESKDTILGDDWYKFLLRCRYFIGVEGGSTVLDKDGSIWKKGMEYVRQNPSADFEEVEKNCFKGMDGSLRLIAISPRHLEACMTETCQILIEGDYNGILKPNKHYIELKADFSNLNKVLEDIKNEPLREEIVKNAYTDVVESGKYSYKTFVNMVLDKAVPDSPQSELRWRDYLALYKNNQKEKRIIEECLFNAGYYKGGVFKMKHARKKILFTLKSLPYTILIKLGVKQLIPARAKIKF
jgi:hypothetical protein